jgi:acyl-CoA thioesterase FadM
MLGDELEILTRVSRIGNKSSDAEHLIIILRDKARIKAAAALTKLVSYDYQKLQSIPIPEKVKEQIKLFEGEIDK